MSVSFGDNVRIAATKETEAAGVAGLTGKVFGETTPSVTKVEVIGDAADDYAINVHLAESDEAYWFAPELVEFVDHDPGAELRLEGVDKVWTRSESGDWIEASRPAKKKPWWRFW